MKKIALIIGIITAFIMAGCNMDNEAETAKVNEKSMYSRYDTIAVYNQYQDSIGYMALMSNPFCDTVQHDTIKERWPENTCRSASSIKYVTDAYLRSGILIDIYESGKFPKDGVLLFLLDSKDRNKIEERLICEKLSIGEQGYDFLRTNHMYMTPEKDIWGKYDMEYVGYDKNTGELKYEYKYKNSGYILNDMLIRDFKIIR